MNEKLGQLFSILKEQSDEIAQLNMDYAVERTLVTGVMSLLSARGLLLDVDFDEIAEIGSRVGNSQFSSLLASRIERLKTGSPALHN
ncbi:hypothetical protein [Phyllobacterium zundukense]|jgi:hypothetical protein|uniref:Uncharacterized protein n=1 Tax=Phyllobacterium zundukense TaxID=1867719 RepID=A0ACD4D0R0_9HYPH|nr:hypothetical protein [Phyllobacterium zundukense]UXN59383.1 hypothetical protein N8E88_22670 [Phyllobacterium zundukense]